MSRVLIAFVVFATISGGLAPAMAGPIAGSKTMAGHWEVYAFEQDGRFSHCAMSAVYKSGMTMYFSISSELTWRVGWSHPEWKSLKNHSSDIAAYVDDNGPYILKAVAANNGFVAADLPDPLYHALFKGDVMSIQKDGNTYKFSLSEMYAAFNEILNCVERHHDFGSQP
jgi:hypothetical protein